MSEGFNARDALQMLQRKCTIDFGAKGPGGQGGRPPGEGDNIYVEFHLDYLSIVGRPLCSLSPRLTGEEPAGTLFDNFTMTFRYWSSPYAAKHVSGINFDLKGRTFRIAKAGTREAWYIVMHPLAGEEKGPNPSRSGNDGSTAMSLARAEELADYIIHVFQHDVLSTCGV